MCSSFVAFWWRGLRLEAARKKFKMQIVRFEFSILSLRGLFFLAPGQHPASEPAISHQSVKQHLSAQPPCLLFGQHKQHNVVCTTSKLRYRISTEQTALVEMEKKKVFSFVFSPSMRTIVVD
jgi:hypothetical protein